jgi:3-oxoacyl-[acyl-carrier protein] reductase
MADLTGKTAVVTGGSRGIGRAIVERLAKDGAAVVFAYRSRDDEAREVEKAAPGSRAVKVDLAQPGAVDRLFEGVDELDILVNNAAADFRPTPITEVTEAEFDRVVAVNVKAVYFAIQYAARHMRDNGRIINISTLNTTMAAPGAALYGGTKGAIEQIGHAVSREIGLRGITVNAVSPGATDTELLRSTNSPEQLATLNAFTPLGRIGEPADIADIVAFLAGPDSRWITGQNIHAGGGLA